MKQRYSNGQGRLSTALIMLGSLLLASGPLRGLEISLEENKGERGSVGFVDLKRVFNAYPETQRAKEEFATEISRREESLNLKKTDILRLRAELANLKQELAAEPPTKTEPPSPPSGSTAAAAAVLDSTQAATTSLLHLPGMSTAAVSAQAPPTPATAALIPSPNSGPAAQELTFEIAQRSGDLSQKEADLKSYQKQVERELLDMESRKNQILLGHIYEAIRDLAQAEGISVVMDKKSILFGQPTVDLTDKLLARLQQGS